MVRFLRRLHNVVWPGRAEDELARETGLRYVFTGNIHDPAGQGTYCHVCEALLIGRDWYDITSWTMTSDGECAKCGEACAGLFEARAGVWGSRRLPVRALTA